MHTYVINSDDGHQTSTVRVVQLVSMADSRTCQHLTVIAVSLVLIFPDVIDVCVLSNEINSSHTETRHLIEEIR